MKIIIFAILLLNVFANVHPVNQNIVEAIQKNTKAWIPMEPEENPFAYKSIEEIRAMMGTKLFPMAQTKGLKYDVVDFPKEFDARKQWPEYIHKIRDQGQCGSCYAFGASGAFSDRLAIASKGTVNHVLSPQKIVSCDTQWSLGCDGGILIFAWSYMIEHGLPTEECFPYSSQTGNVESCRTKCVDDSEMHNYQCEDNLSILKEPDAIKQAIYSEGPVEASFTVYQDFMNYKSGVYYHITGSQLGGHAVKILGWGFDEKSGLEYWLAANSWNEAWGDKGFFKIKIGDCEINNMYCATAVVS